MKHLVIVYGSSSAMLYVQEAIARGLRPIVVNPPVAYDPQEENFKKAVGNKAIYIEAKSMDDQSDVIEELKKYDIACIVPGAAGGVKYAEKLIDAMGFEGNGYDSLWRRDTKEGMQQSLKEAGLRYVKSIVVTKEQDIIDFFRENKIKAAFMKPSEGASSIGGKKCPTPDDAIEHYRRLKDADNAFGWKTGVILQEFIDGTEYIVNSVSCEGRHIITDMWRYRMIIVDNNVVYEKGEFMMAMEPRMRDLVKYAYKVLDATGFKIGPCHGEYMIDDKGPVLIETNPRPMGASMTMDYLDETLGHHITDIALDAYLDKEKFEARRKLPYRPKGKALVKNLYAPRDMDVNFMPYLELLRCLKSYKYTNPPIDGDIIHVKKTVDLDTSPLFVKMSHADPSVVVWEAEALHFIEDNYPDLVYVTDDRVPTSHIRDDCTHILGSFPHGSSVLICTDEGIASRHSGKGEKNKGRISGTYDGALVAETCAGTLGGKIKRLRDVASHVKGGGRIIVTPGFYGQLPYKADTVEIILQILDYTIDVPSMESADVIVATRKRSIGRKGITQ